MRAKRETNRFRNVAVLLAGALALPLPTAADDRELVKGGSRDPYLHVIFDVSGSMNWSPPNNSVIPAVPGDAWAPGYGDDPRSKMYQAKSALYTVISDPALRNVLWGFSTYNQDRLEVHRKHWIYTPQAEPPWALNGTLPYPVIGVPKHFGDHCMDDEDNNTSCDLDDGQPQITGSVLGTCSNPQVLTADAITSEQEGELYSFPVLGDTGGTMTTEWVRFNGTTFRLRWLPLSGPGPGSEPNALGSQEINVQLELAEVTGSCPSVGPTLTVPVTFERAMIADQNGRELTGSNDVLFWQADYLSWPNCRNNPNDPGPVERLDAGGFDAGFFHGGGCTTQIRDMQASNTCAGWEPNDDESSDLSNGIRLKYLTQDDPLNRHSTVLDRGDVIPLDWKGKQAWGVSNRDAILQRLSPNYDPTDPSFEPDFRSAPYFEDHPTQLSTKTYLRLRSEYAATPPLLPQGATPIGNSMKDFMDWYDDWKPEACDPLTGDSFFPCRTVNLLILTDGDETCYGDATDGPLQDGGGDYNPCKVASLLSNVSGRNIRTFVIGFGVQGGTANFLDCIAVNGRTDAIDLDDPPDGEPEITGPILPENEEQLVAALRQVVQVITTGARSFSSAAVPQGQVNVEDKVYLTNFLPERDQAIWSARVDAYLKPVPLIDVDFELPNGTIQTRRVPNPSRDCQTFGLDGSCHLWNGGEELLAQAAEAPELVPGDYNLGSATDERRVYHGRDSGDVRPFDRQFFAPPNDPMTEDDDWLELLEKMGICAAGDTSCAASTSKRDEGTEVLEFTHGVKTGVVAPDNPQQEPENAPYILGDIFHSDPRVIGGPDNFRYWVADVGGNGNMPLDDYCDPDPLVGSPDGYRCYFARHRNRRKLLLAGANDGQLHAFDAGVFRADCVTNTDTSEQFVVGEFDNGTGREVFSYVPSNVMPTLRNLKDSSQQQFTVDGRITAGDVFIDPAHLGTPTPGDREWRTVVMGGLREGGSGYYMLDVTHPDELNECDGTPTIPQPLLADAGYVPTCLDGCTAASPGGSSNYEYPMVLFEFHDDENCGVSLPDGRCDDNADNRPDLADSWSTPTIGRIRVQVDEGGTLVAQDRYVAVFAGGMDAERKGQLVAGGNYLYMVDIETGKAIYKRILVDENPKDSRGVGSAPSDVAAVDRDQNGYLDTIYVGTTGGYMYKADISEPRELVDLGALGLKVTDSSWAPFPIFDTGNRPIHHPPAVVFVSQLGQFALGFGTGDREDLWSPENAEGRLYMLVDRNFTLAQYNNGDLPRGEGDYPAISAIGAEQTTTTTADLLRNDPFGWFIKLAPRERVITRTFSLGGVTVFSSFQPSEEVVDGAICLRRGSSRVFVVNTTNANAFLESSKKYFVVEGGFLSAPFVESGTTTNPDDTCIGPDCVNTDAEVPQNLDEIMSELRGLLPPQCRFANYTINIKAVRDDTGIQFLAAIPVCTVRTGWRDF